MTEDPLTPSRGYLVGLILGGLFWLAVAAVVAVWLVLR
jgi:hypothetical protein